MATYSINNGSAVAKAFKVLGGHSIIAPGEKGEVDTLYPLTDAQVSALEADGVKVSASKATKGDAGLKAEHHGGGKFRITEGEKVILTDLSKGDADAFNALSEAEKAEFVADKAKA